jgi:hypothetical protein
MLLPLGRFRPLVAGGKPIAKRPEGRSYAATADAAVGTSPLAAAHSPEAL